MSKDNNEISISIDTTYLHQESDPENNKFYFLYTVSIINKGNIGAKLLSRHWVIEDANGKVQDVKGEGVVGDQPYINPGDEYQYTSGTVLETSLGTMKGSYQMINDSENYFDAEIP
jgi:ApaG protein